MNIFDYTASNLLMFSPDTYFRIIELYNQSMWPLQFVSLFMGFGLLWVLPRPFPAQKYLVIFILAISWGWVGYGFHYLYFSTINWFAFFYAITFFLQACLILIYGLFNKSLSFSITGSSTKHFGVLFLLIGLLIYPMITTAMHGFWRAEFLGLMAVPTLMVTLGTLLLTQFTPPLLLMILPIISATVGSLSAWTIGSYEAVSVTVIAILSLIITIWRKFKNI